jgi:hypothetical protein
MSAIKNPQAYEEAAKKFDALVAQGLTGDNAKTAHLLAFALQNFSREQEALWAAISRRNQRRIDTVTSFRAVKLTEETCQEASK